MITTPAENILPTEDHSRWNVEYMTFYRTLPKMNRVALHKERMGQHTRIFTNDHKMWVWERPEHGFAVYVSNSKGIYFEVSETTTVAGVWQAWQTYKKIMKV